MEVNLNFESDGTLPAIAVGDQLEIDSALVVGDHESTPGISQLRVTRAGELIAYDASTEQDPLSLPGGITLEDGEALCYGTGDDCDWKDYALDVTSGDVTVKMRGGETATVGSYRVALHANRSLIDTGHYDAWSSRGASSCGRPRDAKVAVT